MAYNKDELFREVTLRLCSSLDIVTALGRVHQYLQTHIDFNELFLAIRDKDISALRLAAVSTESGIGTQKIIPLTETLWEWTKTLRQPFIFAKDSQDKNIRALAPLIDLNENTDLSVPLWVEDELVGILSLRTKGKNNFTSDNIELLAVVAKPFAIALANAINYELVLKQRDTLIDDNRFLNREILTTIGDEIIGGDSGLRNVMEMVQQVAPQNSSVLLFGETGTGKEVIASAIHFTSPRKDGPFIKVNCGAISENLIDSELFGHEKGAFTGAVAEKRGRFERANGGTLFLDEIGELPLQSQVRLLRVLQSRQITRVGGEKAIPVDVRIIAATNRDLQQMTSEGRFREDLWYRLNVFPITIPPLRERKEDIPALVRHFVIQKSHELGIAVPPPIIPGALEKLMNFYWAGNVRELGNLVERELICHRGGQLRFDCLCPDGKVREIAPIQESTIDAASNLDDAMRLHIGKALKTSRGKINGPGGAAELLGIIPNTLRGRMRKLGIGIPTVN